jgi:excisionase family DNA binding protein
MSNNLVTPKKFYELINKDNEIIIGIDKIYELVRRKDFPALKIGGRYYILENKVDEWFSKQAEKFWC